MGTLQDWSANFDREDVEPFLRRIAASIESGFGDAEVREIMALLRRFRLDTRRKLTFGIRFAGEPTTLRVRVVTDEMGTPDLYFVAPAALCEVMRAERARIEEELLADVKLLSPPAASGTAPSQSPRRPAAAGILAWIRKLLGGSSGR